jgi:hypothetical protein
MKINKYKTFPKMKSSQIVKNTSGTQKVTKFHKDFQGVLSAQQMATYWAK